MSIIQKIFSALNADEKQAVKTELAQAELKEGTTIEADSFEEGQAVFIITEDGEKIPMPEGTYELEDGRKVEVNDSSMIVAIGSGEEEKAEEVEQEAKEEMEDEAKEAKEEMSEEVEAKEDEKEEELGDMDKLKEELRQYVREVVMEAMQEKAEMSSEETTPEASAEETEEKAEEKPEEVAVEASAQKVSAKIKVKPEGTRPDTIDWFKPQMRSSTMGNVFKHINK
jgi:ribosomal protein L21E